MLMIFSPMEQFEVYNIFSFIGLYVTNFTLFAFLVVFFILGFYFFNNNGSNLIYNRLSIITDIIYDSVYSLFIGQSSYTIYFPFIFTLFNFILVSNLFGNIPMGFTISTSIIYTIGLSFIIFISTFINSIMIYGIVFFANFIPNNTPFALLFILAPIEVISYTAKAFSLGIRLLANMAAGHSLLHILAGFLFTLFTLNIFTAVLTIIPFALFVAIVLLEIAVSFIQAYVFSILTSSYINDSFNVHLFIYIPLFKIIW